MHYLVTHGTGPVGIDQGKGPKGFDLNGALEHAHRLINEGRLNVTITDGSGQSITGADLLACCTGKKTLTTDLKATE